MSTSILVSFNLLVNAIGSFAIAWLLSRAAMPLFRHTPGKVTAFVVALPFVKVLFDLARGVPADAFLWQRAEGVVRDVGSMMLGLGMHYVVPNVALAVGAVRDGHRYGDSAADVLGAGLVKHVDPSAPLIVLCAMTAVAALLLARRVLGWCAFRARRASLEGARVLGVRKLGGTVVRVLVDAAASTPYTGGILRPFVAVPTAFAEMPAAEREAALAHEIGHVAERHVLLTTIVGLVTDLFWFVPGIRGARDRFHASCEASADRWAVDRGVHPVVLASALVRCREIASRDGGAPVPGLAAVEPTTLARVGALLGDASVPRYALVRPLARVVGVAWVTAAVLASSAFGNH